MHVIGSSSPKEKERRFIMMVMMNADLIRQKQIINNHKKSVYPACGISVHSLRRLRRLSPPAAEEPHDQSHHQHHENNRRPESRLEDAADDLAGAEGDCEEEQSRPECYMPFHSLPFTVALQMRCHSRRNVN